MTSSLGKWLFINLAVLGFAVAGVTWQAVAQRASSPGTEAGVHSDNPSGDTSGSNKQAQKKGKTNKGPGNSVYTDQQVEKHSTADDKAKKTQGQ